ncbi:hypothetical protein INT45_010710 [Circinella minor]|uniref:Uncharacterized protein n=1 Tax=Circinella minor TaxID=1195481 RepID=A0A8H7VH15_9FUNG|nr:hypothetical protein INT45_010710 [Circinella minor]
MNPTNQQPAPTDPYLNLLLQIRDSVLEIRDSVRGIEQRVAVVEDHLGINPQQHYPQQQQQQPLPQQQQQPLSQSLGAVAMPPAAYRDEEQQEQLYRDNMALHYQPPPGAPDLASTGIIERYSNGKDKKAVLSFLKINGNIGKESVNSMYKSLLKESRTHKRALEHALDQSPSVMTYRDLPPQTKRIEIERFEGNIKYMYKLPINKCKDHWVANYFIHNVFKSIIRYINNDSAGSSVGARSAMSRMGLSSQRGASPTPPLQMQGSFMSITSDHTESHTQD